MTCQSRSLFLALPPAATRRDQKSTGLAYQIPESSSPDVFACRLGHQAWSYSRPLLHAGRAQQLTVPYWTCMMSNHEISWAFNARLQIGRTPASASVHDGIAVSEQGLCAMAGCKDNHPLPSFTTWCVFSLEAERSSNLLASRRQDASVNLTAVTAIQAETAALAHI